MENKINVAELLKNCPKGMELDCTMYDGIHFDGINDSELFPITITRPDTCKISLTKYGQYTDADYAKCVIFPKGKTTWEGFVPPVDFKDGDILYTRCDDGTEYIFIFENITKDTCVNSYLHLKGDELRIIKVWLTNCDDKYLVLPPKKKNRNSSKQLRTMDINGTKKPRLWRSWLTKINLLLEIQLLMVNWLVKYVQETLIVINLKMVHMYFLMKCIIGN